MGKLYGLTFNGVHNKSLGITLLSAPRPIMAQSRDEYIDIPGTNGSHLIEDGTYEDITITARFFMHTKTREDTITKGYAVGEWLTTAGRKPLVFDDYPGRYYLAKASSSVLMEVEENMEEVMEFSVTFRCDPIMKPVIV